MEKLIYEKIYDKLKQIGILDIKKSCKFKASGYMDLNIDILEDNNEYIIIAMAHNFLQNGDVMADPDMEVKIHKKLFMAEALTFQQDSLGLYQNVYPEPGKVNIKLKKQLNIFLNQWLKNIINQGFKLCITEED